MKLSVLAVVLLALGIVLGLALRDTVFVAEAKPPEPEPQIQPVEEQNVDASGHIAVHEQGVADVNVTNASLPVSGTVEIGNLPPVQDVNVVSMPLEESGPLEFTTVHGKLCQSETALCTGGAGATPDVTEILASLSAQGWDIVAVTPVSYGSTGQVVFTLSRPIP
jgi:hypothetical protein